MSARFSQAFENACALAPINADLRTLVIFRGQSLIGTRAEGFSRASSNLALITIALGVWFEPRDED
jgi:hypothetical protein